MNGANILGYNGLEFSPSYVPDVTSYDYDAPLSECGGYTAKYNATRSNVSPALYYLHVRLFATLLVIITVFIFLCRELYTLKNFDF